MPSGTTTHCAPGTCFTVKNIPPLKYTLTSLSDLNQEEMTGCDKMLESGERRKIFKLQKGVTHHVLFFHILLPVKDTLYLPKNTTIYSKKRALIIIRKI